MQNYGLTGTGGNLCGKGGILLATGLLKRPARGEFLVFGAKIPTFAPTKT